MSHFSFNGHWTVDIVLDALKGFQSRHGDYTSPDGKGESDGSITLNITDELNDDPDPSPEQLAAIEYLFDHQHSIVNAMLTHLFNEYPQLKESYGGDEEEEEEFFPTLQSMQDLRKLVGFGNLHLMVEHKDGVAYLGFEGGCLWDEEHGIGFMMHKDRVIDFGQADTSFNTWEAYRDNGTIEAQQKRWQAIHDNRTLLPKPRKYHPHPKYGKLKPSQEDANKAYEFKLIEQQCNAEFIALIESRQLTVDTRTGWVNMTFLQRACQFGNDELVIYILSKQPTVLEHCIQDLSGYGKKELIDLFLQKGVDINHFNDVGETALSTQFLLLNSLYRSEPGSPRVEVAKDMIRWLIARGADPHQKNRHGRNVFNLLDYFDEPRRNEIGHLLQEALSQRSGGADTPGKKWNWKFWQ